MVFVGKNHALRRTVFRKARLPQPAGRGGREASCGRSGWGASPSQDWRGGPGGNDPAALPAPPLSASPVPRPQVVDVAKLMKAYISMIVKKRYSTSRSVSSQGSSR